MYVYMFVNMCVCFVCNPSHTDQDPLKCVSMVSLAQHTSGSYLLNDSTPTSVLPLNFEEKINEKSRPSKNSFQCLRDWGIGYVLQFLAL